MLHQLANHLSKNPNPQKETLGETVKAVLNKYNIQYTTPENNSRPLNATTDAFIFKSVSTEEVSFKYITSADDVFGLLSAVLSETTVDDDNRIFEQTPVFVVPATETGDGVSIIKNTLQELFQKPFLFKSETNYENVFQLYEDDSTRSRGKIQTYTENDHSITFALTETTHNWYLNTDTNVCWYGTPDEEQFHLNTQLGQLPNSAVTYTATSNYDGTYTIKKDSEPIFTGTLDEITEHGLSFIQMPYLPPTTQNTTQKTLENLLNQIPIFVVGDNELHIQPLTDTHPS